MDNAFDVRGLFSGDLFEEVGVGLSFWVIK